MGYGDLESITRNMLTDNSWTVYAALVACIIMLQSILPDPTNQLFIHPSIYSFIHPVTSGSGQPTVAQSKSFGHDTIIPCSALYSYEPTGTNCIGRNTCIALTETSSADEVSAEVIVAR